jgi:hypothetical protein
VPLQNEALCQRDHVILNSTSIRVEAVRDHAYAVTTPLQIARGASHAAGAATVQRRSGCH